MIKKLLLYFILTFSVSSIYAQSEDSSGLRISLLTCGVGDEIWAQFGHTAIRVTDTQSGTDLVYNYGTFSYGEGFELQFMKGKLNYYVSYYPYSVFLEEYAYDKRSVSEQVLILKPEHKHAIQNYLVENAKPQNRYYLYDFFFDNCATRIRDIFPSVLGEGFEFGQTLPKDKDITYRQMMNHYFYRKHFERVGCNILLGSKIDKVMSQTDVMWVPDYLSIGVAGAKLDGQPIAEDTKTVLEGRTDISAGTNWVFVIMVIIAVLCFIGYYMPGMKALGDIMSFIVLFISGLLGIIIVIMWFFTDHQGCQNNFNIFWALPTNLFLAFLPKRNKDKYAWVAIILIFISLILHIIEVQGLPLLDLTPFLLAILLTFSNIIRKSRQLRNGNT